MNIKERIKSTFKLNKIVSRIFAAFFLNLLILLLTKSGNFTDLSFAQDTLISTVILIVFSYILIVSIIAFFVQDYPIDSQLLFIISLVLSLSWIFKFSYTSKNIYYFTFAVIIFFFFVTTYTLKDNEKLFEKIKIKDNVPIIIMIVFGAILTTILLVFGISMYISFGSPNFDFGIFTNIFYNLKKYGLPLSTCERDHLLSHFGVHFSPVFYLLLPIYIIFPSPITIIAFQAVAIGSGIIPFYFIMKKKNLDPKLIISLLFLYLVFPIISKGTSYDFHENCFLLPFLLWIIYFFEVKKIIPMAIFALLSLLVKEDASIYVMIFGIYALFLSGRRWEGLGLVLSSLLYFIIASMVIARLGDGIMVDSRFGNLIFNKTDGLFGVLKTIILNFGYVLHELFTDSIKTSISHLLYFLLIFLSLGFIPLVTKKFERWILLLPILINLISSYYYQTDVTFQYNFGISAIYLYLLIINIADLKKEIFVPLLEIALISSLFFYSALVVPQIVSSVDRYKNNKVYYQEINVILDKIPSDASVVASSYFVAHLSSRDEIYELYYHDINVPVDFVVIDISGGDKNDYVSRYESHGYLIYDTLEDHIIILKNPDYNE